MTDAAEQPADFLAPDRRLIRETIRAMVVAGRVNKVLDLDAPTIEEACVRLLSPNVRSTDVCDWLATQTGGGMDYKTFARFAQMFRLNYTRRIDGTDLLWALTLAEVADRLSVRPSDVERMIAAGELLARYPRAGKPRVPAASLAAYLGVSIDRQTGIEAASTAGRTPAAEGR